MESLHLQFDITPIPKQSVRGKIRTNKAGNKYIHMYQASDIKQYEENIKILALSQRPRGFKLFDGPIEAKVLYCFAPPASLSKKRLKGLKEGKIIFRSTKPDLTDNLNKPFFDALEGVIFTNDSRIVRLTLEKVYAIQPCIIAEFTELENEI